MTQTTVIEKMDTLRFEASDLILHINYALSNPEGLSVASLTSLTATKADAERAHNHICRVGEYLVFGHSL